MKTCTKCKEDKEQSQFSKAKKGKDGLKAQCKSCCYAYNKTRLVLDLPLQQAWVERNPDKVRAHSINNYHRNKERYRDKSSTWQKSMRGKLSYYKSNASIKGLAWELTDDEFYSFESIPCYYCSDVTNVLGIDRIDSTLGYNMSNCRSCCTMCNMMKRHHSDSDFLNHVKKINDHMNGNNIL